MMRMISVLFWCCELTVIAQNIYGERVWSLIMGDKYIPIIVTLIKLKMISSTGIRSVSTWRWKSSSIMALQNGEDEEKTSHHSLLESQLSGFVRCSVRVVRLHASRQRHGVLLLTEEHVTPRIHLLNGIGCDVSGLSSALSVALSGWVL